MPTTQDHIVHIVFNIKHIPIRIRGRDNIAKVKEKSTKPIVAIYYPPWGR